MFLSIMCWAGTTELYALSLFAVLIPVSDRCLLEVFLFQAICNSCQKTSNVCGGFIKFLRTLNMDFLESIQRNSRDVKISVNYPANKVSLRANMGEYRASASHPHNAERSQCFGTPSKNDFHILTMPQLSWVVYKLFTRECHDVLHVIVSFSCSHHASLYKIQIHQ